MKARCVYTHRMKLLLPGDSPNMICSIFPWIYTNILIFDFLIPFKKCYGLWVYKNVFKWEPTISTLNNYHRDYIFENIDVSKSKFEWEVSELLKCLY